MASKESFKLEEQDHLKLQNLMLKLTVEQERIEKHKAVIAGAQTSAQLIKLHLESWKSEFNKKLNEKGLDINTVEINAESGIVIPMENMG